MSTLHHHLPNDVLPPPPPPPPPPPTRRRRRRNRHRRRRPPTTENNILQSSVSVSSEEIDLESGELEMEMKVHCLGKIEKQCRICHLGCDGDGDGVIELGCDCKGDIGAAHKQCAETWFKIKGNMTCEICGATTQNVGGEQIIETSHTMIETEALATGTMVIPTEPARTCWRGRRIMNILLGCMVFAFIISWLFHFNVLP